VNTAPFHDTLEGLEKRSIPNRLGRDVLVDNADIWRREFERVGEEPLGNLAQVFLNLTSGGNPMLYSTDRIITTHAGSLPRPPDLRDMVVAKANSEPYDPTELDEQLKSAVAEVVRRQVEKHRLRK